MRASAFEFIPEVSEGEWGGRRWFIAMCVCVCNLFPAMCTSITLVICILLYELLLISRSKNCGALEEKQVSFFASS
jgi:hypothetical protein